MAQDDVTRLLDHILVRRVFAEYVQAVIHRDGAAVQAFFAPDAFIRNFTNRNGQRVPGAAALRASEIGAFVSRSYHPYHPGMWSHILHTGEIVDVDGGSARYRAQVTYLNSYTQGPDGAPLSRPDMFGDGHAGEVVVTNCGMWEAELAKMDGGWKISELRIIVDIPYVAGA